MRTAFASLLLLSAALCAAGQPASPVPGQPSPSASGQAPPGVAELHRLDLLPAFRRSVSVGGVSSYDRTGGNNDGFEGTYSFIRKEPAGLVIADLKGPGVGYRI